MEYLNINDSIFDAVSTHYVNLAYEIEVSGLKELMQSDEVHHYVKDYFIEEKGTVS